MLIADFYRHASRIRKLEIWWVGFIVVRWTFGPIQPFVQDQLPITNIREDRSNSPESQHPRMTLSEDKNESDDSSRQADSVDEPLPFGRNGSFSIWRLASKELRETLRDRRTIITLVVMPLLVYPILSLVFRTFLISNADAFNAVDPIQFSLVCNGVNGTDEANSVLGELVRTIKSLESESSREAAQESSSDSASAAAAAAGTHYEFVPIEQQGWQVKPLDAQAIQQLVRDGTADLGVVVDTSGLERGQLASFELIADDRLRSELAARWFEDKLLAFNEFVVRQRLKQARLPVDPALTISKTSWVERPKGAKEKMADAFSLSSLLPLILVLMTITGAVYPAIDLTAGERERGTLEMLMAAPVPGTSVLFGKFFAVLAVSVLTALLNLIGMAATVWAFQLDQYLPVGAAFDVLTLLKILGLLILFAAFFSALLLAVTSNARSFKEAQAWLIPIILLSLGPGLMAMTPGLSLNGVLSITPMMNILLLARDVIQQTVLPLPAAVAMVSTLVYTVIAVMMAARTYGSSGMLYGDSGSMSELFLRPVEKQDRVPVYATVICTALLLPVNFLMIGLLGRLSVENAADLTLRFAIMGAFTVFSFVVIPWLIAVHQRAIVDRAFGLNLPHPVFWMIAILLGVSLWPLVMGIMVGWQHLVSLMAGVDAGVAWHERLVQETAGLVEQIRRVSPLVVAVFLAVVPAACEEFFFRGMLLRSLLGKSQRKPNVWRAIFVSAFVFALFHVISNSVIALDRLLPTFLVGLILGFLAWKSNSIWPGVVLHTLHNAAVAFLGYYEPVLRQQSWFPVDAASLPISWIVVASGVCIVAIFCLARLRRQEQF